MRSLCLRPSHSLNTLPFNAFSNFPSNTIVRSENSRKIAEVPNKIQSGYTGWVSILEIRQWKWLQCFLCALQCFNWHSCWWSSVHHKSCGNAEAHQSISDFKNQPVDDELSGQPFGCRSAFQEGADTQISLCKTSGFNSHYISLLNSFIFPHISVFIMNWN